MAFWLDIADFALKAALIVAALGALVALVALIAGRMRGGEAEGPRLDVRSLDERYDAMADAVNARLLDKKALKALAKARRQQAKAAEKSGARAAQKRVFVLDFKGDLRARAVRRLAAEIDAVLAVARPETDEVVLKVESPGGTVTGYGLAAAEVMRLQGAQGESDRLRRPGGGERRLSDGLRRRPHRRRAVRAGRHRSASSRRSPTSTAC